MNQTASTQPGADVEALCSALAEEPMFHASLGSKELFHSNLIAWMVARHPTIARQVFEKWLTPADRSTDDLVRREFHQLDLVIELAGQEALVIENKTFALPDEQQLARNTRAADKLRGHPTLLLLSLVDPGWPDGSFTVEGRTWHWVSYKEFGERLAQAFSDDQDFAGQVLAHEARLVLLLSDLFQVVGVHDADEPLQLSAERQQPLVRTNIADAVGKARAHQVMQLIKERLRTENLPEPAWAHEVGFAHGEPLLAIFWQKSDDVIVGWQYQSRQWRLAMILNGEGLWGKGLHEARATYARQHDDYFDFQPMYDLLERTEDDCRPKRPRIAPDGFNRFDPGFIYRYRLVPDVTVQQFVELAMTYSHRATQWEPEHASDAGGAT